MYFQLRKGIAAIKDNRTVKVKMCIIYLALHFLRHQTHAFNTASLLQIFSTRLYQSSLSLTSCFLKYLPLLKVDKSLFQMILSSNPCGSRYFFLLVLDGQFQNNSCWMWYTTASSFPPKENLGMSWSSWLPTSTLRRLFYLQWPLWLTLPGMTISSEVDQSKKIMKLTRNIMI